MSTPPAGHDEDDQDPSEVADSNNDEEIEEEVDDDMSVSDSQNDCHDLSTKMDSEGHHSQVASGCYTPRNRLSPVGVAMEDRKASIGTSGTSDESCTGQSFTGQKELNENQDLKYPKSVKQMKLAKDNRSKGREISVEDSETLQNVKLYTCETVDAEGTSSYDVNNKDVVVANSIQDHVDQGTMVTFSPEEEINREELHLGDTNRSLTSRSCSSVIRTRSLFSSAENNATNKRPAAICEFFAKGWCIRGTSCKFLHVKDDVNNTNQLHEGHVTAATVEREEPVNREMILPQEQRESKSMLQLPDNNSFSSLQNGDIVSSPLCTSSFPKSRSSLLPEYIASSNGPANPSKNCSAENLSYLSNLDKQNYNRSQYMHIGCSSSVLRNMNSSLSTSSLPGGNYLLPHVSTWTRSALSLNACSSNSSLIGTQKLLQSGSSASLRCSSPFSSSLKDKPSFLADYKSEISPNDWEPSVPFRPSLFIPSAILSSAGSQYDPFRDSFDLPNTKDLSSKFSIPSAGASNLNVPCQQINGDSTMSRTVARDCNGDKSSASFQGASNENVLVENDSQTPGKDSNTAGAEAVETSMGGDGENETIPKADELSISTHTESNSKSKICDGGPENDGSRHKKKNVKGNKVRKKHELDGERKTEDLCKESKPMRHLRAAIIDLVKELLKPSWREGHLSKDAHKTIVKKVVDKVLGTLQPHQIPTSIESANHYLSSSQPKIGKLVEGYVDKYGKS